ncbi:MAG: ParB/RepB/Spo0J family partition protein [Bdellovibrio sp.]|nr:ParB/RepB/Spo0J family partition protein [Bdellovibrio sp.]
MDESKTDLNQSTTPTNSTPIPAPSVPKEDPNASKIKTRQGSGYLKQLYSTARTTAGTTHSHLKNLTTFLVNFVPIDKVDVSELQVRVHFDDAEIVALSQSVKEHGVLQPILVVQDGDRYKVIAGERRLRASKMAGMDRIPARVLSTNDKSTHEIALRENLDRVDLHPIEEGEGYVSLLDAKAYPSHDAIAKAFGKPKSRITECIGFTRLPKQTKEDLLQRGIRNRALLRQLLTIDTEKHAAIIADVAGREEVISLGGASEPGPVTDLPKAGPSQPVTKAPPKPFQYRVDSRGVSVDSFKWKKKQDPAILKNYIEALRRLVSELEALDSLKP